MPDHETEKSKGGGQGEAKGGQTFTIFVNNMSSATPEHELTGAQIKMLAAVPVDYELFQVQGDHTVPVGNEQLVHLHNNDHFRAIPAGTFGRDDLTT
jgi:hypothetical protein